MTDDHGQSLPAGYVFEGYRIESVLGSGGFGITYKATEVAIDREVAVKEFLPFGMVMRSPDHVTVRPISTNDDDDFQYGLERFVDEAKTLVQFQHPNIVPVLRYFEGNGTAYLVMTYYAGESLTDLLIREGAISEGELRAIVMPLLDGLREVHKRGYLHRDINPSNIYLRESAGAMLIDFGAARQAMMSKSQNMTAVLTPGYAPFEQYSSRGKQGPWTDIYAMGATIYQAIAGLRPPDATDRTLDDEYEPLTEMQGIGFSRPFLEAVDWALRLHPDDRPQSIDEWLPSLEGDHGTPDAPPQTLLQRSVEQERSGRPGAPPSRPIRSGVGGGGKMGLILAAAGAAAVVAGGALYYAYSGDGGGGNGGTGATVAGTGTSGTGGTGTAGDTGSGATVAVKAPLPKPGTLIQDCAICPQLVVIPTGSFLMGSPTNEAGRDKAEGPQHRVKISTPLAVGRFEVTFAEWDACVADGGCNGYKPEDKGWGRDTRPVINVSWEDVHAYLAWLGKKSGKPYRLLSEAEWEYAARGGTEQARFWDGRADAGSTAYAACKTCGSKHDNKETAPVGSFPANAFGLHDMLGNVWEWVADCWFDTYEKAPANGAARSAETCAYRVSRGGSFISSIKDLRAAVRGGGKPGERDFVSGFRVARPLSTEVKK